MHCSDAVIKVREGLEGEKEQDEFQESKQRFFGTCSSAYCFACAFDRYAQQEEGSWQMKRITIRSILLLLLKREQQLQETWSRQMIMGATIQLRRFPSLASSLYPIDSLLLGFFAPRRLNL